MDHPLPSLAAMCWACATLRGSKVCDAVSLSSVVLDCCICSSHQTTFPVGSCVRYQFQRSLSVATRNNPLPPSSSRAGSPSSSSRGLGGHVFPSQTSMSSCTLSGRQPQPHGRPLFHSLCSLYAIRHEFGNEQFCGVSDCLKIPTPRAGAWRADGRRAQPWEARRAGANFAVATAWSCRPPALFGLVWCGCVAVLTGHRMTRPFAWVGSGRVRHMASGLSSEPSHMACAQQATWRTATRTQPAGSYVAEARTASVGVAHLWFSVLLDRGAESPTCSERRPSRSHPPMTGRVCAVCLGRMHIAAVAQATAARLPEQELRSLWSPSRTGRNP